MKPQGPTGVELVPSSPPEGGWSASVGEAVPAGGAHASPAACHLAFQADLPGDPTSHRCFSANPEYAQALEPVGRERALLPQRLLGAIRMGEFITESLQRGE